jgi:hypothetical protein
VFPVAIIAYNHVTSGVKVLVKNKDYDRLYRTDSRFRES